MGQKFDTKEAFWNIHNNTTPGPGRTAAYIKTIKEADESGDPYARLHMRADMAVFVPFYDDAVKVLPYCAEFMQIAEEYPEAAEADDVFTVAREAATLSIILPQIELPTCEKMFAQMEKAANALKRSAIRRLHMIATEFYTYIDLEKAEEHYNLFRNEKIGMYSACNACEQHMKVWYTLKKGDIKLAREMANRIFNGGLTCHDIPWQTYAVFLEHYMDEGNINKNKAFVTRLIHGGLRDVSDLANAGTVLRCMPVINLQEGLNILQHYWKWTVNMWNQQALYFFYKGAWCCCRAASANGKEEILYPPQGLNIDNNTTKFFEEWFYNKAEETARKFDKRNGTDFYIKDLGRA
ncbi:MAG: hypothetical protein OSJ45_00805 [Lachnospiraceae bacterium]|nr:hypothetical protein [Lachnospiraceae bacterium]